jgi:hypothetical protein
MVNVTLISFKAPRDLVRSIKATAKAHGSTQSEVIRRSLWIGLPGYSAALAGVKDLPPGSLLPYLTPERAKHDLEIQQAASLAPSHSDE